MSRPDWDRYFIKIAEVVAARSTCPRAAVGAVLVVDRRIVGTGYNGAPAGLPHCTEVGCNVVGEHCVNVVHAEANALMQAVRHGQVTEGTTLYATYSPCFECSKLLINAGVRRIVFKSPYFDNRGDAFEMLMIAGVKVEEIANEADNGCTGCDTCLVSP